MKTTEKYRVTRIIAKSKRRISWMNYRQLEKFRAKRLQAIRKEELGLTQKALAEAVGANLRTLQDWEMGRSPMPKPVEKLLNLMREMPSVRKKLLAAH
jgi:DNA-binding transcriptional regulator YiaG